MKIRAALLTVLSAAFLFAAGACAPEQHGDPITKPSPTDEFLADYDISDVVVEYDSVKQDITLGLATFEARYFTEGDLTMGFRIYTPEVSEQSEKLPVFVFLHGAGERGNNNRDQLTAYPAFEELFSDPDSPFLNAIVIAPQCPQGMQWVDVPSWDTCVYSTDEIPESRVLASVLKILRFYSADPEFDQNRIYAMGLSMGGYACWDLAVRHPDLLTAIAPICGGCDTSKSDLIKNLPIYTFHGSVDTTVPPTGTREMYARLEGSGNITYIEYEGKNHNVWDDAMRTPGFAQWMFSKTK